MVWKHLVSILRLVKLSDMRTGLCERVYIQGVWVILICLLYLLIRRS